METIEMLTSFYLFICFVTTCLCCDSSTISGNNNKSLGCNVRARLDSGWVCGCVRRAEEDVQYASFRGIPYAKQPVRELRFKELQPLDSWKGVLPTVNEGPICPQYDEIYSRMTRPVGMSEACIHGNVHVPLGAFDPGTGHVCQRSGLPILVFVHGGGFQTGSGDSDMHGPEYLVSRGVIVMTFNYRINVFGFLSLNSSSIPGNNGLRDIITFLKWVKRNARAFGGDPDNVTLAGQSCGSVGAHLVSLSEASKGLMKRLILISGVANGGFYTTSPAYAETVAIMFLSQVGINSIDPDDIHHQLIHMPLEKIMDANRIIQLKTGVVSFVPVVESQNPGATIILDDYPQNLIRQGRGKDLPIIVGTTEIECEFFKRRIKYLDIIGRIEQNPVIILPPNITYSVSQNDALRLSKMVEDKYFQGGASVDKYVKYCTNTFFLYPALRLVKWRSAQEAASTYLYQFAFDSDFNAIKYGLMLDYEGGGGHVEDQTFILRMNAILDSDEKSFPPRTRDDLMKHWMTTIVVNFMKYSHPFCENQSAWPAADAKNFNHQLIKDPLFIYNHVNMTKTQRSMFDFHDRIHEMAGGA